MESEQEVHPLRKTGLGQGKPGRKILKSTPLKKGKSAPRKEPSMKELTTSWNRQAHVGLTSETVQGWLKKTEQKRDNQNRLL